MPEYDHASWMRPEHQSLFHQLFETRSESRNPLQNITLGEDHHGAAEVINKKSFCGFALQIAYKGDDFCGWQTQPNNHQLPSLQQILEDWLQPLYQPSRRAEKRLKKNHDKKIPRPNLRVSGRTDAGVHAIGQIARFRTYMYYWENNGNAKGTSESKSSLKSSSEQLLQHMNQHPLAGSSFQCLSVTPVSPQFHPTFGATCRAYVYLIDTRQIENMLLKYTTVSLAELVSRMDTMLRALEGRELDYVAMSYGKVKTQSTECNLLVARAFLATRNNNVGSTETHTSGSVLGIQLVGNRFLRRMVRILVATTLREALAMHAEDPERLGNALETRNRSRMARPAPPQGLVFVGALYDRPL
jgi:tRNA pseudouridine(38-40) synthase